MSLREGYLQERRADECCLRCLKVLEKPLVEAKFAIKHQRVFHEDDIFCLLSFLGKSRVLVRYERSTAARYLEAA